MKTHFNPEWLEPRAAVPVDCQTVCTLLNEIKAIHQAITDPENQPSQFGTVTLEMYEKLDDTAEGLVDTVNKQAKQIYEMKKVLREINDWAMPMRDAPRSAVPDWFYKIREFIK